MKKPIVVRKNIGPGKRGWHRGRNSRRNKFAPPSLVVKHRVRC